MNYYGAKELASSFRTVRQNTIVIAEQISEEQYGFRAAEGTRSVAETLLHIAATPRTAHRIHGVEHLSDLAKFDFADFFVKRREEEKKPHTKEDLLASLREGGEHFAGWLDTLTDEFLGERVAMGPGNGKTRFEMLLSTKEHEMHHRAQLMLMERMMGITPHLTIQLEARLEEMRKAKAGA